MPLLNIDNNINTNAVDLGQAPSARGAGMVADAWGQVGKVAANFSADLMKKRQEAEIASFHASSKSDLERFAADKTTELEAKYPGDPSGMTSEFLESLNEWGEDRLNRAPSDSAKNVWQQSFDQMSNHLGMSMDATENKKRVDFQKGLIDENVYKDQQHLASKPDPTRAANMINNAHEMVSSGTGLWFDENEAKLRARKYSADLSNSLMEGFEANKQYGVGMAILNGDHPTSKIVLAAMDPKEIANKKDRFQKLIQAENEFSKSMFTLKAGDTSKKLQDGLPVPQNEINSLIEQSKALKGEERAVFLDNLETDRTYNAALQKMKALPINEVQNIAAFQIPRKETDSFNYKSRTERDASFRKAATELFEKRKNDAPEYHIENDRQLKDLALMSKDPENAPAINEFTKNIVSKQLADKVSSPKIFNKDLSETWSKMLKAENPEMAEKVYQGLNQGMQVGNQNYAQNAISDMLRYGHIDPVHAMALSLDDSASRKSALYNITKKKAIDEQFKNIKKASDSAVVDNEHNVLNDNTVNEFKSALMANTTPGQSTDILNGFDELLKLEYKSARIESLSQNNAKKRAIERVISKNFVVAKKGNSQVVLGSQHMGNKEQIQNFMSDSLDPETLKENFKLSVPQGYVEKLGLVGKTHEAEQRYLQDISANGVWISDASQNGVTLYKKQENGKAQVLDASGNPVYVPYSSMRSLPNKAQRKLAREAASTTKAK